jgi:uncharacterized repeat protein (TIGR01451 family)
MKALIKLLRLLLNKKSGNHNFTRQIKALLMLFMFLPTLSFAWWNCSWTYSQAIVVGNTSGGALTNTVIELHLTPTDIPNYVWGNGDKDLRFIDSDNATQLNFFVMPHKTTDQELLVWVKIPSVPTGGKTIYIYYGNSAATSTSSPTNVLVSGIRMWTRQAGVTTLSSYNSWWNAWNAAAPYSTGYGCKIISNMTNVSNQGTIGGTDANILFSYVTVLTAGSSSTFYLRHGPDYGYGGGLYMNDTALQEKYGTNMWWNGSWTDATQLLQGSSALTRNSYYVIRSYGGEDSADGAEQMQLGLSTLLYQAVDVNNYTLNAPPCEAQGITKAISNQLIAPTVTKSVVAYSDPINNTTNPKLIPGGIARYTITITNPGGPTFDANSLNLTDIIPTNTKMYVGDINGSGSGPVIFTQGSVSSGLTYTRSTDLTFSNNSGSSYAYTPTADANGFDTNVTNLKINPKGTMACTTGTTAPSAIIQFEVGVK